MKGKLIPLVYLVSEVAHLLGESEWTIYEMVKRDEIPGAWRLGNKVRVTKSIFNKHFGIGKP